MFHSRKDSPAAGAIWVLRVNPEAELFASLELDRWARRRGRGSPRGRTPRGRASAAGTCRRGHRLAGAASGTAMARGGTNGVASDSGTVVRIEPEQRVLRRGWVVGAGVCAPQTGWVVGMGQDAGGAGRRLGVNYEVTNHRPCSSCHCPCRPSVSPCATGLCSFLLGLNLASCSP